MLKNLGSYSRYVIGGVAHNAKSGKAIEFISNEILRRSLRIKNGRIRRRLDSATSSDFVPHHSPRNLAQLQVFSFCHREATPEQKLSILSFLRHVGTPAIWSIVSDGSITNLQAESLRSLHPCIKVVNWTDFICDENRSCCETFSKYTIFAKKLALESNLPVELATIYCDSDILFFGGGHHLATLLDQVPGKSYYQRDLPGYLDAPFLKPEELAAPPLNAGFVILGRKLDWSLPIQRLEEALTKLTPEQMRIDLEKYEQAVTHLAHFLGGSEPLDKRYVLQVSDQLSDGDDFCGPEFVMRHYSRPVRHKMWRHASEYLRR